MHIMYVGSYVMEDIRITCSRRGGGVSEASPPGCKLQEQMLDVAGPLTCLWVDLLNKEALVSAEDMLLLVQ